MAERWDPTSHGHINMFVFAELIELEDYELKGTN